MKKPRKVELYEVLSHRRSDTGLTHAEPESTGEVFTPRRLTTAPRTGREVVLSLDVAFVLFVVVLALLATSFLLGVQRGEEEARVRFVHTALDEVNLVRRDVGVTGRESPPEIRSQRPDPSRWTLRLRSPRNRDRGTLEELRDERLALLQDETLREEGFEVFVLDKGAGSVYSLSVGVFTDAQDGTLKTLREHMTAYRGADNRPRYPELSVQQFRDLGDLVE